MDEESSDVGSGIAATSGAASLHPSKFVSIRVLFSPYYLRGTARFAAMSEMNEAQYSTSIPEPTLRELRYDTHTFAIGAVMNACSFLEATINETIANARENHPSMRALGSKKVERLANIFETLGTRQTSILDKFQLVLMAIDLHKFNKGTSPYQEVDDLIALRNALVHFSPEVVFGMDKGPTSKKLEKRLKGKFPECALYADWNGEFWPFKCLGTGCARWAFTTSVAFANEFFLRLNIEPMYQRVPSASLVNSISPP